MQIFIRLLQIYVIRCLSSKEKSHFSTKFNPLKNTLPSLLVISADYIVSLSLTFVWGCKAIHYSIAKLNSSLLLFKPEVTSANP